MQIVPLYSMECQQVEHMPVHIVRDNAMPACMDEGHLALWPQGS